VYPDLYLTFSQPARANVSNSTTPCSPDSLSKIMAGDAIKSGILEIHQSWIPYLPPLIVSKGRLCPQFADVNWNHWNTGATMRMLHTSFGNLNPTSRDANIHSAQYSNDMIFVMTPYHQVSKQ
jgi:hypothetical protein